MHRKGKAVCALVLVQLLAWGAFVPTADAGKMIRVSAQFRRFSGDLDVAAGSPSSTPGVGGIQIYTKTFNVPTPRQSGMQPVVFVTITAVFATGSSSHLSCVIDGAFCNAGGDPLSSIVGWVHFEFPQDGAAQIRAYQYTWCAKVNPGSHTVSLRLATHGSDMFVWNAYFYVDRSEFKASDPDDCELGAS